MRKFVLGLLILTSLLSCSQSSEQRQTAIMEEAIAAINSQNYDRAINLLSSIPEDSKTKDLLSSAYAGRAGFNSAKLADMITTNQDPLRILYSLTNKYSSSNIRDSQMAIYKIYENLPTQHNSNQTNIKYASIQVYKISQILIKNYLRYNDSHDISTPEWEPCSEAQLLSDDLKDIIISVNRAIIATQNIETKVYEYLRELQLQLNIDPDVFEDTVVRNIDVSNIRIAINKEYLNYMGQYENANYNCNPIIYK